MSITCTPIKQDFLVTGHGRSGTNYMAALFGWLGYEVGARKHCKYGMAHNFPAAVNPNLWPFDKIRERYNHLIHVVRHPQKVLASTLFTHRDVVYENATKIPEISQYRKDAGSNIY